MIFHVVSLVSVQNVYFAMDLAETDVWHLLNVFPDRCMDEECVLFYGAQLSLAVGHVHEHGFIHRDVKPENILVCGNGFLMLTDFSTAVSIEGVKLMDKSRMIGTPTYIAPEIIREEAVTPRVDWWSVGVVLYEFACKCSNISHSLHHITTYTINIFLTS